MRAPRATLHERCCCPGGAAPPTKAAGGGAAPPKPKPAPALLAASRRLVWPLCALALFAAASAPYRGVVVVLPSVTTVVLSSSTAKPPSANEAGPPSTTTTTTATVLARAAAAAEEAAAAADTRDGGGENESVLAGMSGRPSDGQNIALSAGGGEGGETSRRRPATPLRSECLDVVRRAGPPVDLTYEDVSGGHVDHPHRGATHEDGATFGYVPDAEALRRDPPPLRLGSGSGQGEEDEALARACSARDSDYRMLTEKVRVDAGAPRRDEGPPASPVKILCLVYTVEPHHDRLAAIRETWGQRCDGFLAASNKTDQSVGAVNIPHAGPDTYDNMWQKVRSIWSFVYDAYYDKYDWFHLGGDDMYVIVDNLRLYLGSEEIRAAANGGEYLPDGNETVQVPLFLGRRYARKGDMSNLFNSGGPGYTLNRAALKVLVARGMPRHYAHERTSEEDVKVAQVLRQLGVHPYETKDGTGAERYMPYTPGAHYDYRLAGGTLEGYDLYAIDIREGTDCCSERSVAFHYASPGLMRRMHALLYGHCPASAGVE